MNPTQYTEQQAWNVLAGNAPNTLFSGQQAVNNAISSVSSTSLSEQQAVNNAAGLVVMLPEQATLNSNLINFLGLNGSPTQYTVQILLNMAINAGLSLLQVLGLATTDAGPLGPSLALVRIGGQGGPATAAPLGPSLALTRID
jgi:hypothetical protein